MTAGGAGAYRLRRYAARVLAVLSTCLLGACSINPPLDLGALLGGQAPLELASVPFFPQEDYLCGPAALAGILGAAGVAVAPATLAPQVYLPGRQGSLQLELLAATRRSGRIPYLTGAEPAALFSQLGAGRPVLVLQNLQTRHFPVWHYAVLVGFDITSNQIYLNSGGEQGLAMSAPAFLRTWEWAGRWGVIALRPGEMPAAADASRYMEAVASFETVAGGDTAAPAWLAALGQWPQDPRPYLALGNQAYSDGHSADAVDYYRRGLEHSSTDPALANNLASVLGELGCPLSGIALLQPIKAGLAKSSRWHAVIAVTLSELEELAAAAQGACVDPQPAQPVGVPADSSG